MFEHDRKRLFRPASGGLDVLHPNGATYHLHGLGPRDAAAYADHLCRLSLEDRRMRFHGAMSDAGIRAYCDGLDWSRRLAIGISAEGVLRGVGELARVAPVGPAELGLSVESAYRHAALGRILVAALLTAARLDAVDTVQLLMLKDNGAMQGIARDIGARLVSGAAATEGEVRVAPDRARRDPAPR